MDRIKMGMFGRRAVKAGTPDSNLDEQTMLVDSLTNVMHYADLAGLDMDRALESALNHYEAERNEAEAVLERSGPRQHGPTREKRIIAAILAPAKEAIEPVTIMAVATDMLGREATSGADYQEAGLPMMGGCENCGATIAAYNAYPSTSGFLRCEGCIGDDGYPTVRAFYKDNQ
ncbi:hypothetical protein [Mycobacterium sp.]|uniref:hypothetical protein n=1 Tax=Mycobacterium sp. TaxID=1785 RepID=UPI002601CCA1|nr:hypothetical protein [Mycobacterium sp.]